MGSPWKAISDDSRREILLLIKKKGMVPTEIVEHFNSPNSTAWQAAAK